VIAKDWRRLSRFYIEVFRCTRKPPERNLKGEWLDSLTALKNARIRGVHLNLPGCGPDGPTLEIFQYSSVLTRGAAGINQAGFSHIAFSVPDVEKTVRKVLMHGGSLVGDVVSATIAGMGAIDVGYVRDPEGNIIEIQKWGRGTKKGRRVAAGINEHIARFPPEVRRKLARLRAVIREEAPDAREKISYGIPTFDLNGNLVHFAGFAHHIGFYPTSSGVAKFRKELAKYKTSKGTVQFPLDGELPIALIRRIVRFRVRENASKGGSR
jgi:uncharacterized protein YdhG (YjbR/CyaY superfamily)